MSQPALEITYIGGPTVLVSVGGCKLIVDPTFDPAGREYPRGAYSLKKTRGPAIGVADLGSIDVALVSHEQHPDNLDDAGRELLANVPVVLTTPASAARIPSARGLAPWSTYRVGDGDLRITATPARHGPVGVEALTGDVTGFVATAAGRDVLYATGDTVWYEGTCEVARRFDPRVVLLFGGAATVPRGPFHLTMDTNDAIEAAAAFPRSTIVPVHHDGWAHFTQSQEDLAKTFEALGRRDQLELVTPGKTLTFEG